MVARMDTPRSGSFKRLAAGCLLAAAAAAAKAESSAWTTLDYSLAGGAAAMMALDWAQTRYAARHPSHYSDRNPIMGEQPSTAKVDQYFAIASLLMAGVTYVLPRRERRLFLSGVLVVETSAVVSNYRIGVKVDF
jgi:hypothetical protein